MGCLEVLIMELWTSSLEVGEEVVGGVEGLNTEGFYKKIPIVIATKDADNDDYPEIEPAIIGKSWGVYDVSIDKRLLSFH